MSDERLAEIACGYEPQTITSAVTSAASFVVRCRCRFCDELRHTNLELVAKLAFISSQETPDTEQAARAQLVRRVDAAEALVERMKKVLGE